MLMTLAAGAAVLIAVSSLIPENKPRETKTEQVTAADAAESYCRDTEKKLAEFLSSIEGAGDVNVYLAVNSGERYVYAAEGKRVISDNRSEEEEKYVMVGGGSDRAPLVERVEVPQVIGAVIVCSGCGSPVIEERIYKAASAALGIPTSKIYVTKGNFAN